MKGGFDTSPGIIEKIISGGQTGADRAALDWAIASAVPHGGWCPRGRKAEDGTIPERYTLTDSPSANYLQRTEWNARDADGTAVFTISPIFSGGSKRTVEFAARHCKPWIHLHSEMPDPSRKLMEFIKTNRITILNVAGSRGSKEPGVAAFVVEVLSEAFNPLP